MFSSKNMNWCTPQKFFEELDKEFYFVLDVAATDKSTKCEKYFTPEDDGLSQSWNFGGSVFCNPPYGREIGKWVKKAYEESLKEKNPIVLLIPARTDTKWFHDYIYNKAEIRFIKGRLKFEDEDGNSSDSAPFPSMIVIYNRKEIIKGKTPSEKRIKFLSQYELHSLLETLELNEKVNWDWLIYLIAKTGMRFSEALAITPKDFDFSMQTLNINKTLNYKNDNSFMPTKNKSSVRKIRIDWQTATQFAGLIKGMPEDKPIFYKGKTIFNSTVNDRLTNRCKLAKVPEISIHGLRHTHASILLYTGVSTASVSRRLGHSSIATTQKVYLHIIQELENQDVDLVMRSMSNL